MVEHRLAHVGIHEVGGRDHLRQKAVGRGVGPSQTGDNFGGLATLGPGATNLAVALALGQRLPPDARPIVGAALIGLFSYGASLALFVLGLRKLGSARTAALFGTAPLSGVVISWLVLGEVPKPLVLAGGAIMIAGVAWMSLGPARSE